MGFADFVVSVPAGLRLLLCLALFIGLSLLAAWRFHGDALALTTEPRDVDVDGRRLRVPSNDQLTNRAIEFAGVAFVFLAAFTLVQFWGNSKAAEYAVQEEAASFATASVYVEALPEGIGRDRLQAALAAYRANVIEVQWPAMRGADGQAAYAEQMGQRSDLLAAEQVALADGNGGGELLQGAMSAIEDMTASGADRIDALPGNAAPAIIVIVFALGLVHLVLIGAFKPTTLGVTLVLTGVVAAITGALVFVVVELSNPYLGPALAQPFAGG